MNRNLKSIWSFARVVLVIGAYLYIRNADLWKSFSGAVQQTSMASFLSSPSAWSGADIVTINYDRRRESLDGTEQVYQPGRAEFWFVNARWEFFPNGTFTLTLPQERMNSVTEKLFPVRGTYVVRGDRIDLVANQRRSNSHSSYWIIISGNFYPNTSRLNLLYMTSTVSAWYSSQINMGGTRGTSYEGDFVQRLDRR